MVEFRFLDSGFLMKSVKMSVFVEVGLRYWLERSNFFVLKCPALFGFHRC